MDIGNQVAWSSKVEEYLKSIGEKAHCYSYLHKKAEAKFNKLSTMIDIPSITLSTICGTLSIGNSSLFGEANEQVAGVAIGCFSLIVGILGTVGSYFAWNKRTESHRITHLEYGKLYRFIQIELSLPREQRVRCCDLVKIVRENFERLAELSPLIPDEILRKFKNLFKSYKDRISFPTETNGLEEIEIYSEEVAEDVCELERKRSLDKKEFKDMLESVNNELKEEIKEIRRASQVDIIVGELNSGTETDSEPKEV